MLVNAVPQVEQAEPAAESNGGALRLVMACSIGSVVEWYDFAVFATAAVLVFDRVFFPKQDPMTGVLLGLMTYGSGFLSRPLGAVFFGYLGDRYGRKIALYWSLILMGAATAAIGLIPGYAVAGLAAPAMLVIMRIVQGFAVGGEVGGAALLVGESLNPRRRAFWIAGPMSGAPFGNALGAAVLAILIACLTTQQFFEWGWRLAFFLSIVLVFIGAWLRRRIGESPIYLEAKARQEQTLRHQPSLWKTLISHPKSIVLMLALRLGENTLFYMFTTFSVVYATRVLHMPRQIALTAVVAASVVQGCTLFFAGMFADRYGRRPAMLIGFVGSVIWIFAMFPIAASGGQLALFVAFIVGAIPYAFIAMGMVPTMVEIFPTEVRYTGFSASFQIGSLLSGSIAPAVGVALLEWSGGTLAVSCYCTFLVMVSLIAVYLVRETLGTDLRTLAVADGASLK